jgi:hypothetical protein
MFAAFGIAVEAGRDFDERDTPTTTKVMIVNEAFARRFSARRIADRKAAHPDVSRARRLFAGHDDCRGRGA